MATCDVSNETFKSVAEKKRRKKKFFLHSVYIESGKSKSKDLK